MRQLALMKPRHEHEPEHRGSIWTHPYLIYVYLTAVIFGVLLFLGWMALENGWIPSRGIHGN